MSRKLPVNGFKWVEEISKFKEDFIKAIMKRVIKDISLKFIFNIQKNCMSSITIYFFYEKE